MLRAQGNSVAKSKYTKQARISAAKNPETFTAFYKKVLSSLPEPAVPLAEAKVGEHATGQPACYPQQLSFWLSNSTTCWMMRPYPGRALIIAAGPQSAD
jgi:hypothetical protein